MVQRAAGSYWEHTYTTNDAGIVDVAERDADAPPCGTYTITELRSSVNIGYILPTDKQETFTYGDKIELYFYNAPEMGTLRVLKTDDLDNHFVAGVEFQLKGTSLTGDEINLTAVTDSGGVAEFPEVPVGKYLLYEDNVPFHFVKPDPEEVTVVYARTEEEEVETKPNAPTCVSSKHPRICRRLRASLSVSSVSRWPVSSLPMMKPSILIRQVKSTSPIF